MYNNTTVYIYRTWHPLITQASLLIITSSATTPIIIIILLSFSYHTIKLTSPFPDTNSAEKQQSHLRLSPNPKSELGGRTITQVFHFVSNMTKKNGLQPLCWHFQFFLKTESRPPWLADAKADKPWGKHLEDPNRLSTRSRTHRYI